MTEPIINLNDTHPINLSADRWRQQGLRAYVAGISGSGKTNLVAVFCEELHRIGVPFIIADPMDDYRSLKALGHNVAVASGRDGDIEVSAYEQKWVDQVIAFLSTGFSVIVDFSRLFAVSEKRVAYGWLVSGLLRHQMDSRKPMFFVVEEAHIFCPQKRQSDVEALELTVELARQGRRNGINLILASQRPRDLEADVASQCNLHFCGELQFQRDYDAVRWLLEVPQEVGRATKQQAPRGMVSSLVTETPNLHDLMKLKTGQFYVRVGSRLDKIQVRKRRTVHLGATPAIQGRLFENGAETPTARTQAKGGE